MPGTCAVRLFFVVLILCCTFPLSAQVNATGAFSGQVTDPTGAAFANAKVEIVEQQTGISITKLTNTQGYYSVPLLKPGTYSIQVSAPGFASMISKNLVLQIQQTIRQDFRLQVGRVGQEVTVTSAVPLLNTESGEIGSVIAQRSIEQLPLNGRNFSQLGLLVPGTNPGAVGDIRVQGNGNETQRAGAEIIADGSRGSFSNFMIDGMDDRDQSVGTIKVFPNLESIQEFQVQTGNYDAQFASGGAVVNVITRSGSNQIHGSAFEFLRNDALDARQFFDAQKPQFQQNQFGFAIGGPIRKNKTFYFGDYQGLRVHTAPTSILSEPTAAMRTGDFSGYPATITDPNTSAPFPGNVIPANRIDPVAKNLLTIMPLPNLPGVVNNLRINPLVVQVQDQFDVRVDQLFSPRDAVFARYTYGRADITYPATPVIQNGVINPLAFAQGNTIAGSLALNHAPSQQATLQEIHQFKPNLSNQLALSYTRFYLRVVSLNEGFNIASLLGLQGADTGPNASAMSTLTISGESGYDSGSLPEIVPQNTWQLNDTVFYTHGTHLLRFGFSVIQNRFGFFQLASPSGALDFSGTYTTSPSGSGGAGFADFLLGLPVSAGKSALPLGTPYERYSEYGAFGQDQWHATKRLTVSLGLRYDLFTPVSERHNRQSDFLFTGAVCEVYWALSVHWSHVKIHGRKERHMATMTEKKLLTAEDLLAAESDRRIAARISPRGDYYHAASWWNARRLLSQGWTSIGNFVEAGPGHSDLKRYGLHHRARPGQRPWPRHLLLVERAIEGSPRWLHRDCPGHAGRGSITEQHLEKDSRKDQGIFRERRRLGVGDRTRRPDADDLSHARRGPRPARNRDGDRRRRAAGV